MIQSITGNEDVGKRKCADMIFCSLNILLFLGKTQLGTKLYLVVLYTILWVWKLGTNMSSGLFLKFIFKYSLREDCNYFV